MLELEKILPVDEGTLDPNKPLPGGIWAGVLLPELVEGPGIDGNKEFPVGKDFFDPNNPLPRGACVDVSLLEDTGSDPKKRLPVDEDVLDPKMPF